MSSLLSQPVQSEDTLRALFTSALRAHEYVIEANEELIRIQRLQLDRIRTEGKDPFEELITKALLRLAATNALYHYHYPRLAKFHRSRLRRYLRLKYQYEQEHPLFTHPEFPEHPSYHLWREGVSHSESTDKPVEELTEEDDEISPPSRPKPLPVVSEDLGSPPWRASSVVWGDGWGSSKGRSRSKGWGDSGGGKGWGGWN
ncbi:hypothetical protein R3P38DRAFT_3173182 [Favolaschia claudopus]|uniref:Uncharacterized protein n=1 Tax=Favolaschia claudopus TaxID=2862362 RepID=A0AAW0DFL7_9AGAR